METFTLANTELTKVKHLKKKNILKQAISAAKNFKKKSKKLFQNACIVLTASPTPPPKCFHQAVNKTPSESEGNRLSDRLRGGHRGYKSRRGDKDLEAKTICI